MKVDDTYEIKAKKFQGWKGFSPAENGKDPNKDEYVCGFPPWFVSGWSGIAGPAQVQGQPGYWTPVIRFKSKIEGTSVLKDLVQGDVESEKTTIEDFIILRNDGTPTYVLSATVDDHQMKMTHIFSSDDHKINIYTQIQIYLAMR